ncbi:hypothetical protein ASPBRDRAFT_115946 [Aspergillus brasiliensis CBS 101740]|uniref:Uncharacterized protein n=1 Tax=Aspergillus brasiliensis (strain CBS 101740 / IMI 381727 / IBT 21946) TaxID=767769 RepID=A0A1L9UYA4_ASPBC|nr:hypothetical protein ASPBRDRAFT_115946 [Aspergillus brasiliensis CBS 101740]
MAGPKRGRNKKKTEAQSSDPSLETLAPRSPSPGRSEDRESEERTPKPGVEKAQERSDTPYPEYSRVFLTREEYKKRVEGINRLLRSGSRGWELELKKIVERYKDMYTTIQGWVLNWGIGDVGMISKEDMNLIIGALDGYCVQEDWPTLKELLPTRPALDLALAEALISKAIATKILSNSFQYLDAKSGSTDQNEDESFATNLQYLYDRFFKVNPNFATLWKQQTHRLANSTTAFQAPGDLEFGQENIKRLKACACPLAEELLASTPFRLLLKEPLSSKAVLSRQRGLVEIFEQALCLMRDYETRVGGQFRMEQLPQLGPSYQCDSPYTTIWDATNSAADETEIEGCRILLVVRPTIVYTHIEPNDAGSDYTSVSFILQQAMVIAEGRDGVTRSPKKQKATTRRAGAFVEDGVYVTVAEYQED